GMPKDIYQLLQKVRVKGQPMQLSRTGNAEGNRDAEPRKKPRHKKSDFDGDKRKAKKPARRKPATEG
ncbi:MAG TPA: hypothetical protein DCE61_00010, partial [Cellvibrionales bacterium]|nr:hypothetical protein [Cellvibrionales bacterium]